VHHGHRGCIAAAHTGRGHHTHVVAAQQRGQACQQVLRASHLAGQAVADAHGQQRRCIAIGQDVEVVVEAGHLHDLGLGDAHLSRQCHQVRAVQGAVAVVEPVQVFDQQITPVAFGWPFTDAGADLGQGLWIDLAALQMGRSAQALAVYWGQWLEGAGRVGHRHGLSIPKAYDPEQSFYIRG
jgi:hypothetical protein